MNVSAGHTLVVNGKEFPIVAAERWTLTQVSSGSFRRQAILTVSLKKESFADGKGDEGIYATSVSATPLDPVDAKVRSTLGLETPHTLKETFLESDGEFVHLVVEDLQG